MTITKTGLDELLKVQYSPDSITQLQNVTYPILSVCAKEDTNFKIGGTHFAFAVRTESAEGHAYISESGALPTARQTTVKQAQVVPVVQAGVVQATGLSVAISSQDAMAFARAFDESTRSLLEAMMAYREGALFRDGTGLLTTFNGDPGVGTGPSAVTDVNYLREGMYIDVNTAAADPAAFRTGASPLKIVAVDWANRKITVDAAFPAACGDGDELYLRGTQTDAAAIVSQEPIGLATSLASSGTYLNINKATVGVWSTDQITASGYLNEDILLRARTRISQRTGAPMATVNRNFAVLAHQVQCDVLFKLAIPRIRYSGNSGIDLGNVDNVQFGNIPFRTSYQAPSTVAYIGDWSNHRTFYAPGGQLHIDTTYNGASMKWVAGYDQGLAFAKSYHAFACRKPNAFVAVGSLTDPSR